MLTIAIPAPIGAHSIGTAGLMDALNKADSAWALQAGKGAPRLFDVCLVGLQGSGEDLEPVARRDGVLLQPRLAAHRLPTPELVVVPGLDDDLDGSLARNRAGSPGSPHGTAPAPWSPAPAPARSWSPTPGCWTAARPPPTGCSPTSSALAAKVLLADPHRSSQLPYVAFGPERAHGDQLVHRIQQHIDGRLGQPLRTGELAAFRRAFRNATGVTPSDYRHRYGLRNHRPHTP